MEEYMNWDDLLKPYRYNRSNGIDLDPEEKGRSSFAKDQDKIIFSSSFRRLSKKNSSPSNGTK